MIKLAHGLSNPPRPDSIIGFVKLTTSPSAPLVSTLCIITLLLIITTCAEAQGGVEASWVDLFVHAERNQRGTFDIGADDDADDDDDDDGGDGDGETF